jgi:hypothetical protein
MNEYSKPSLHLKPVAQIFYFKSTMDVDNVSGGAVMVLSMHPLCVHPTERTRHRSSGLANSLLRCEFVVMRRSDWRWVMVISAAAAASVEDVGILHLF